MSLPNTRIVVTGAPRADVDVQVVEISSRQAHRATEVLAREERLLAAKWRRELAKLKADNRKKS